MNKKDKYVTIGGMKFSYLVFQDLLRPFKEAFSHASLTVEQAFKELEGYDLVLKSSMDQNAADYYDLLSTTEKNKINEILHQIIVYKGSRFGVFGGPIPNDQKQIDRLFNEHFKYFEQYLPFYTKYDSEGNFDKIATFNNIDTLFFNLPQRRNAYKRAVSMKEDNMNAFDYAISLKEITIPEIIKINSLVNFSDPDKEDGFKKTNNDILNSSFTPVDKENVPLEMKKLFIDYENNFGLKILDPNEPNITYEERMAREYKLFEREAIFHIRFERIHPFKDGNGRTGRIILNHHLLKNGLAPVLITNFMSDDYKKFINDYNVPELTKLFLNSSSQLLTNWISLSKAGLHIKRNDVDTKNDKLAVLEEYPDTDKFSIKRRKRLINRLNILFL